MSNTMTKETPKPNASSNMSGLNATPVGGKKRIRRLLALFDARNKEFFRDTGALAWNILFPVLVIGGFGFAFNGKSQDVFKVAVVGDRAGANTQSFFQTQYIQFVHDGDEAGDIAKLRRHQYDMVVSGDRYWVNSTSPKGYMLERILAGTPEATQLHKQTVEGREIRYVDWLISGLLGMNIMFSALFGVGYVIVRYRKNGVLKRFRATPLSAFDFLLAQVGSRLAVLVVMTSLIYAGCNAVIHFQMLGSYFDLLIVLAVGSMCLISLGLLVAAMVSSEEFAGGILNLISWPMMFLSGVWFSLEGMHPTVKATAQIFPLTHVIDSARAIMTEGATLGQVAPHLIVLSLMTAVFLAVGAATFKWE